MTDKIYLAIDLKSFYASVECVERKLDPLTTNLVVADSSRTEKTVCLAITPSLKSFGLGGRARLFEVIQKVKEVNRERLYKTKTKHFTGKSYCINDINKDPNLEVDFIIAKPQMAKYIEISSKIYSIYLKYVAPEDIFSYSIDEVFIDVTNYLNTYKCTPHELALKMIKDVLNETGITATAGVGTNLYLAKVAMDILAKKMPADQDGVRIAELNEMSYRKLLWDHTPLKSFWRVGSGYVKRLEQFNLHTMGDIVRFSLTSEDLLYKAFGVNAELLIDHAWGYEPTTLKDIKNYKPAFNSVSSGQVLSSPYSYSKARIIVFEMTDQLVLDLVNKNLFTNQIVLEIGYDAECLSNPEISKNYNGETTRDWYGREVPKHAHGTVNLDNYTSSSKIIVDAVLNLYDKIINKQLLIRRVNVIASNVKPKSNIKEKDDVVEQLDLFTDYDLQQQQEELKEQQLTKENNLQKTVIELKKKYGKNAVLKAINFEEGSTAKERNNQIGGHKA